MFHPRCGDGATASCVFTQNHLPLTRPFRCAQGWTGPTCNISTGESPADPSNIDFNTYHLAAASHGSGGAGTQTQPSPGGSTVNLGAASTSSASKPDARGDVGAIIVAVIAALVVLVAAFALHRRSGAESSVRGSSDGSLQSELLSDEPSVEC